jgi:predicted metal-dependent phosphoesterase TrpH
VNRRPATRAGGRRVDLHTHTIFSDGLLTPEELVARAVTKGLVALAITDHDSVEALPRALAAAPPGLELVPGIEISTSLDGLDLHLLGYYVDPEHRGLRERLERFHLERRDRARAIVRRLATLGLPLDEEQVLASAGPGVVGRPHVAAALISAGHVADFDEAFRRYLGLQGSAYVARPHFHPEEAIALIHGANGVSVLAHPGPMLTDVTVQRLVSAGLRGIEVWHPLHGTAMIRRYRELVRNMGLIETGGSDFHGQPRGTDLGDIPVPAAVLDRLKSIAGVAG